MKRQNPTQRRAKSRQPDLFEIGDELFFTMGNGTAAGEGFYIGHAAGNGAAVGGLSAALGRSIPPMVGSTSGAASPPGFAAFLFARRNATGGAATLD